MSNPSELARRRVPEKHRLVLPEVEVVVPVGEEQVRQAVGHGDGFFVESLAGMSRWEVIGFESTDPNRPHTRKQAPDGLDAVALGLSGVREDGRGAVQEVRGRVDRFPVAYVATSIHNEQQPR